jgi:hypothetical protein
MDITSRLSAKFPEARFSAVTRSVAARHRHPRDVLALNIERNIALLKNPNYKINTKSRSGKLLSRRNRL